MLDYINEIEDNDIILDIGITGKIDEILKQSKTILFEYDDFANGTNDISRSIGYK